jgi:DNA-directed RNA polymerase subunit RPC12/RpoP
MSEYDIARFEPRLVCNKCKQSFQPYGDNRWAPILDEVACPNCGEKRILYYGNDASVVKRKLLQNTKRSGIMPDNSGQDLFWEKMKIIDTRIMLNRLISLNLQLFNEIRKYAYENGIPLTFSPSILRTIKEIEETDKEAFPSDDFSHDPKFRRRLHRTFLES